MGQHLSEVLPQAALKAVLLHVSGASQGLCGALIALGVGATILSIFEYSRYIICGELGPLLISILVSGNGIEAEHSA